MRKKFLQAAKLMACALMVVMGSCSAPKNITYFQDAYDQMEVIPMEMRQIKVEPNDRLSIVVKSKDPALSSLFNLGIYTNRIGNNTTVNGDGAQFREYTMASEGMSAYTVSPKGTIDFPVLGTLYVAGMTRAELSGFIKGELVGRNLVKDPTVTVEFLSTGISVMGEVNRPGRFDLNKDNLTILEAISLAGDLTIQGQRKNVLVIREEGGKTTTYRVDLTNTKNLVGSPVYYLKQNDMIYVEPNNMKKRSTTVNGNNVLNASFWISVASLLSSVAVLIFK